MFEKILDRFRIEASHFRILSLDARRMIASYVLYLAAYPLIATFMNAYLWRSSGNIWSIILYNLGYCVGLPIGFYANGLLLKRFHISKLYFLGLLLQAAIPSLVLFFPLEGILGLGLYGMLYGFGAGLFWGNKSYIDLQITRGTNRVYYNSMGQIFDFLMNIIVPASAGWFIVLVSGNNTDPTFYAYKIVMLVAFLLLFFSGLVVQFSKIKQIVISGMLVRKSAHIWGHARVFNLLFNFQVGATLVIPNILTLILVGNEGILGTVSTVTAGLSAVAIYIVGRKASNKNAPKFVLFGSLAYLVATMILAGSFTWIGVLAYSVGITLAWASQWTLANTVIMDLIDHVEPDPEKQYAYICDNELIYNIGRVLGIAIVSVLVVSVNQHVAMRWTPLIVGLFQLPLAWLIRIIVRDVEKIH